MIIFFKAKILSAVVSLVRFFATKEMNIKRKEEKFFMKLFLAIIIMIFIIIASYLADRKYPTKRIFIIPCGIILLCSVVVYTSWMMPVSNSNSISEEQRIAILNEQPYFITWYNDYKENINQLDRFAIIYHKIITNYENQTISASDALEQLQRLYDETNTFNNSLQDALPPNELSQTNYTLVYNILEKTRVYSYKLNETTRQSIAIINEGTYNQISHGDIVNNLNRIYIIEAPTILDINAEVSQIKDNLTVPEA